jgi:hypothetical protein
VRCVEGSTASLNANTLLEFPDQLEPYVHHQSVRSLGFRARYCTCLSLCEYFFPCLFRIHLITTPQLTLGEPQK